MRTFTTAILSKEAKKFRIPDQKFVEAAQRARHGKAYANLGGGVYKERIARIGQGRSRGFRTVLCLRQDGDALFFVIFAKKRKANLNDEELKTALKIAAEFRAFSEQDIQAAIVAGKFRELQEGGVNVLTEPDPETRSNQPDLHLDERK